MGADVGAGEAVSLTAETSTGHLVLDGVDTNLADGVYVDDIILRKYVPAS